MRHRAVNAPLLAAALLAATAGACASEPPPPDRFPVTFRAHAGEPLAGVAISMNGGKLLGVTGPGGDLMITLTGKEGTTVPFRVACPDGYRPPRQMPALTLRRFTGLDPATAARGVEVSIECLPAERLAALVLKTGEPDLPVLAQGREVARTDDSGIAHALVSLPPNSTFRVVVDTSDRPQLRPQHPATTLTLADADDIFLIDQRFEVDRPRPVAKPTPVKKKKKKKVQPEEKSRLPEKLK
jgi:hypothetical protein